MNTFVAKSINFWIQQPQQKNKCHWQAEYVESNVAMYSTNKEGMLLKQTKIVALSNNSENMHNFRNDGDLFR